MKTSYRELDYAYGVAIQQLRNAICLTQAGLADKLGVSWRTVAGWEAGSSYPRAEHLKGLIVLAVQQQAFTVGHEAEEIHVLWKVAHQKTWLDEDWLSALLDQQRYPQGQAQQLQPHVEPELVQETMTTAQITEATCQPQEQSHKQPLETGTTGAPPPLPNGSFPQTLSETTAAQPRRKLLLRMLIALVILIIIGSVGTLLFQQAHKTAADQAYPGYLSGNGTLAFFDPLSQEGKWHSKSASTGGSCQFTGGAFHVSELYTRYFGWCLADGIYGNFAFEVQLTITQGDCGGMTFRDDSNGHFYKFTICQDGSYRVSKYISYSRFTMLQESNSSAIRSGLGQRNKMAIVASRRTMTFYVNERQIDQEQDSSPISGKIALIAVPNLSHATDVAYSNAKLWTL